jgi:hypothetical protein
MGLFKQMKDMKNMVEQAPDMIAQAQQVGAQAQEYAAAQQAAAQQAQQAAMAQATAATPAAGGGNFEPISNVTLEQYASICKQLGAAAADVNAAHAAAAAIGISATDWDAGAAGWGARMQSDRVVGTKFRDLYIG